MLSVKSKALPELKENSPKLQNSLHRGRDTNPCPCSKLDSKGPGASTEGQVGSGWMRVKLTPRQANPCSGCSV